MAIIITLGLLIAAFVGYITQNRKLCNPITTFSLIWAVLVFLSMFGFYGADQVSDKAYLIIGIGSFCFVAGCFFVQYFYEKRVRKTKGNKGFSEFTFQPNYTILYVLYTITLIYLVYQSLTAVRLLMNGNSLAYIRVLYTDSEYNDLRSSFITLAINNYISTPTVYLSLAVFPIELFYGKRDRKLIIMSIVMITLWVLTSGGRSVLIWFIIYFIVVMTLYGRRKVSPQMILFFIVAVVAAVIFLAWATMSRKGNDVDFIQQAYTYFVLPIVHFDHRIQTIDEAYATTYGYGMSSFYGFLYPIMYFLRSVGLLKSYPQLFTTIRDLSFNALQHSISVGKGLTMNAFVTMFYQFYLDGRYIGIVIGSLGFGMFSQFSFEKAKYTHTGLWLLVYLLIYQKLVFSMVRFHFTQPAQAICMIFALLLFIRIKRNKGTRENGTDENDAIKSDSG